MQRKRWLHLEIAAELDSQNIDILEDLMDYYREAPGFLGGDTEKANKIEDIINKIKLAKIWPNLNKYCDAHGHEVSISEVHTDYKLIVCWIALILVLIVISR